MSNKLHTTCNINKDYCNNDFLIKNNCNGINIMYTNTDVLLNKMTELESTVNNNLIHIVAINEILPKEMPDKFTSKEDFEISYKIIN